MDTPRPSVAEFITRDRDLIFARWLLKVRTLPVARAMSERRLVDHLPEVVEGIAMRIRGERQDTNYPEIHALDRLDEGFDLSLVAREYHLLRDVILGLYRERYGEPDRGETCSVIEAVDEAVVTSITRYSGARERTLIALDRMSEAAFGAADLDAFLPRLLQVLAETTEAVDTAAVFFRDGEYLHARASVGLEEEIESGFRVRFGEGFVGRIAAEKRPITIANAAENPVILSPVVKARKLRAYYGVPMFHDDEVIGVATMGSRTAYEFSNTDKLLFRTMVHRASTMILQAQLAERGKRLLAQIDALLSRAPAGIAFLDTDLRHVRINDALAELNGMSAEAHTGRTLREVLGDEEAERFEPVFRKVLATRQPLLGVEFESKLPRARGRFWTSNFFPVTGRTGELFGVGVVTAEITALVKAERAAAEEAARLSASERRFRLALHASSTAVFEQDAKLCYRWIYNAPFGQAAAEVVGKSDEHLFPSGEAEPLIALKRRAFTEKTGARGEVQLTFHGQRRHFLLEIEPVLSPSGDVIAIVGASTDITERKRIEEELQQAASFRELFLGVVSHDLRNPLSVITTSAHLLGRADDLPDRLRRPVARIATAADKIEAMISDLLDFTRGRLGGGIPVDPAPMNLRHLARHVVEDLEMTHPQRKLVLHADGNFEGTWDSDRLHQVLMNLVTNALQYGAADKAVDVWLRDHGEELSLSVVNHGPTIPADLLPTIFEPFRRATEERPSGLGLGLYISDQIVRAHGGRLSVTSGDGRTEFVARFPRHAGRKA